MRKRIQSLYQSAAKPLRRLRLWARQPKGKKGRHKRWSALANFAKSRIKLARKKGNPKRATVWIRERRFFRKKKRATAPPKGPNWPKSGSFTELMYHSPGPHIHAASADRDFLIAVAKIGRDFYGQRIGEFPPFDPVECVHVEGSWHYRDSSSPATRRPCAARGDGLAFDSNDADGGSDQEQAFFAELKRRYG